MNNSFDDLSKILRELSNKDEKLSSAEIKVFGQPSSQTRFLIPAINNKGRLEPKNVKCLEIYLMCLNLGYECYLSRWIEGNDVLVLPASSVYNNK